MSTSRHRSRTGQPAVDFRLDDLYDQPHTLADYRGRWLLLDFHRHLG